MIAFYKNSRTAWKEGCTVSTCLCSLVLLVDKWELSAAENQMILLPNMDPSECQDETDRSDDKNKSKDQSSDVQDLIYIYIYIAVLDACAAETLSPTELALDTLKKIKGQHYSYMQYFVKMHEISDCNM